MMICCMCLLRLLNLLMSSFGPCSERQLPEKMCLLDHIQGIDVKNLDPGSSHTFVKCWGIV
jgi:hypothetical protein